MYCIFNSSKPTSFNSPIDLIFLIDSVAKALDHHQLNGYEKHLERLNRLVSNSGDQLVIFNKLPPESSQIRDSEKIVNANNDANINNVDGATNTETIGITNGSSNGSSSGTSNVDDVSRVDYFSGLSIKEDKSKFYIKFIDKDISKKNLNIEYFDGNYITIEVVENYDGYSYKHSSKISFNLPIDSDAIYAQMNKDGRVSIKVPKKPVQVEIHQVERKQNHQLDNQLEAKHDENDPIDETKQSEDIVENQDINEKNQNNDLENTHDSQVKNGIQSNDDKQKSTLKLTSIDDDINDGKRAEVDASCEASESSNAGTTTEGNLITSNDPVNLDTKVAETSSNNSDVNHQVEAIKVEEIPSVLVDQNSASDKTNSKETVSDDNDDKSTNENDNEKTPPPSSID
jgi:uncharacterized protein YciI